jgi:hypothetical protein
MLLVLCLEAVKNVRGWKKQITLLEERRAGLFPKNPKGFFFFSGVGDRTQGLLSC